uniref:UBC core domain-containing protein n=1 Tax=Arcella intermedia TaxID=1963864 RepID=A0A6B2LPF9_9EUKA
MVGPEGTPYEGGSFEVDINFPVEYPFLPPWIRFSSKVYHPNVNAKGAICLDELLEGWSADMTVSHLLGLIAGLLVKPVLEDPFEPIAAHQYLTDRPAYDQTAKEWTLKFATKQT